MITIQLFRSIPMWVRALILIPALAACSVNNGPGFVNNMSDEDYLRASAEDRAAYRNAVTSEAQELDAKKEAEYLAGRPVEYGNARTGYTIQWVRQANMAYIYPGHTNGAMGMEQNAMMALVTKKNGDFQTQDGSQSPIVLLANVATQEGIGRFVTRGVFQVAGSASSGAIAAKIHSNAACDDDCGPQFYNQVGASAGANSESTATGTGTATAGSGCPSGGCSRGAFTGFGD